MSSSCAANPNAVIDSATYSAPFMGVSEFCPANEDVWFKIRDEDALFRGAKRYKLNHELHAVFLFFIAMNRGYRLENRDLFDIKRIRGLGTIR